MRPAPESMQIVPATAGHSEFVRRLSAEVFARFGDYETLLPRAMRMPWMRAVVLEVAGRPVAFAIYSLEDLPRGEIDLIAIAVLPGWQSRGIGRTLLTHVEHEAQRLVPEVGETAVRLTVAEDNSQARRLFAAAGFRPDGEEPGTYPAGQRSLGLRKQLSKTGLDSRGPRQEVE